MMKRILYIARFLNLIDGGGSNYSLDCMADAICNKGFDVDIHVTDKIKIDHNPQYKIKDIQRLFKNKSNISVARNLQNHIIKNSSDYDLIHIFNPSFLSIAGYTRSKIDTPIIGRLNTYTPFCTNMGAMDGDCHKECSTIDRFRHDNRRLPQRIARSPRYLLQNQIEPHYINKIDRLFAISPSVKKVYQDYGYDNTNIHVIPNMVDSELNIDNNSVIGNTKNESTLSLLYVGRLEPPKGLNYLLNSMLNITNIKIRIDIVGQGSLNNSLQSQSKNLPDNIKINFHGYIPHRELGNYYSNADLFVHPHIWPEPYGRVILEALQFGCPILCTDIGAPAWIAGDACETVPPRDSKSLENKIRDFAKNKNKVYELSQHCNKQISRFSKEKITSRLVSEYNSVI